MKKIIQHIFLSICISLSYYCASAQHEDAILKVFDSTRSKDLTSAKTDVLAELFQASIDAGIISSKGNDISIKSTIFQLKKIWRPDVVLDRNYVKETFNRNFEFGLGFKINNDNKVNGVGGSIKYAIVNKRDVTRQDLPGLAARSAHLDARILPIVNSLKFEIGDKVGAFLNTLDPADKSKSDKIKIALATFSTNSSNEKALQQLKTDLGSDLLKEMRIDQSVFDLFNYPTVIKELKQEAQDLEDFIKKRGLLTFGFGSNYINKAWDSLNLKLEYLKGLGWTGDKDKPWDIYAGCFYDFKKDTLTKTPLGRQVFKAKLGLNKVLIKNADQKNSFLEILGSAEYDYIPKGSYSGEATSTFMADFTLTIRISSTLFLPFELKYDPKNANLFGFIKVKWDMPRTSGKK